MGWMHPWTWEALGTFRKWYTTCHVHCTAGAVLINFLVTL